MWSSLAERIVCINLLEREDRLEQAKKRFDQVGVGDQVTFYRVQRHPNGGRYGCYESHRSVIEQAYKDELNSVLIFEDDVLFNEGWEKVVQDVHAFIQSGVPFDALFLGSKILYVDEKTTSEIWRVKCFEAHAYIVSRAGMKAYLEGSETFDARLDEQGQDFLQNNLWTKMYSHRSESICQDDALGTDHIWCQVLPEEYAAWFQMVVVPKHGRLVRPLVCSDWWYKSWIGRRYGFGFGPHFFDDGRVRIHGLTFADVTIMFCLMVISTPPKGFLSFFYDMIIAATEIYHPKRYGIRWRWSWCPKSTKET